jgi:hypothetical protein
MINRGIDDSILFQQHKYTIALDGSFVVTSEPPKNLFLKFFGGLE